MNQANYPTKIFQTFPSIPGVFENGRIKPLVKNLPFKSPQQVIIVFLNPTGAENALTKLTNVALEKMDKEDRKVWQMIEPTYRRVRKEVFKEQYPELYQKYYGKN